MNLGQARPKRRMRRTVTVEASRTNKKTGEVETTVRLFKMNLEQRRAFDSAVAELTLSDGRNRRAQADASVELAVTRLLGGMIPTMRHPSLFHRLRLAFPILKQHEIARLPRAGCPGGWITEVALTFRLEGGGLRTARIEMTKEQARAYNDAIAAVRHGNRVTLDEAWKFVNNTIGALLSGAAKVNDDAHETIAELARAFPPLTAAEISALPRMTEDDSIRMCFTTLPIEGDEEDECESAP